MRTDKTIRQDLWFFIPAMILTAIILTVVWVFISRPIIETFVTSNGLVLLALSGLHGWAFAHYVTIPLLDKRYGDNDKWNGSN